MTPDDWNRYRALRGGPNWGDIAREIGLSNNQLRAYREGTKPTPRKVALAVSAVLNDLRPWPPTSP
jgi:hypothetical protein